MGHLLQGFISYTSEIEIVNAAGFSSVLPDDPGVSGFIIQLNATPTYKNQTLAYIPRQTFTDQGK